MVRKFKKSGNSRWRGNSKKVEIQDSVEIQKWKSKIARKFIEQEIQDSVEIQEKEIQDSVEIQEVKSR